MIRGDTFEEFSSITWKDSVGTFVDLTGCDATFRIKKDAQSTVTLFELNSGYGRITFPSAGTISFVIMDNETTDFAWTYAKYALWIYFPDGRSKLLLAGKVTVNQEEVL